MFDKDIIISIRVDILNGLEEETAVCLNTPCKFKYVRKPEVKVRFIHEVLIKDIIFQINHFLNSVQNIRIII